MEVQEFIDILVVYPENESIKKNWIGSVDDLTGTNYSVI
jgi:hypothetical protein